MFLFLNSLGTGEVIIIMMVVLMFFGSKNIPSIARTMGRGIRQMKDASQEIQNEITKSTSNMKNDLNIQREIEKTMSDMDKKKPKAIEKPTPEPTSTPAPETKSDKNLEA